MALVALSRLGSWNPGGTHARSRATVKQQILCRLTLDDHMRKHSFKDPNDLGDPIPLNRPDWSSLLGFSMMDVASREILLDLLQ